MKQSSLKRIAFSIFVIFLIFSMLLTGVNIFAINRLSERKSDRYASALEYVFRPIPEFFDIYFHSYIDMPVETLLISAPFISYSFTTAQYPAGEELIARLQADMQAIADRSNAIMGSFIYTMNTESYIASPSLTSQNSPLANGEADIRDIIYNYNAGTFQKTQVLESDHLTFMFQYQDNLFVAKDLTTKSGLACSTIYLMLDPNVIVSYLFESEAVDPDYRTDLHINIYDSFNHLLYTNDATRTGDAEQLLWQASEQTPAVLNTDESYGVLFRSDAIGWQYLFVVNRNYLSPFYSSESNLDVLLLSVSIVLLLILAAMLFVNILGKPLYNVQRLLRDKFKTKDLSIAQVPDLIDGLDGKLASVSLENEGLKDTLSGISAEATSILFSRLIGGDQVDMQSLKAVLKHTSHGFGENDVYVAGMAAYRGENELTIDERYEMLNIINATLERFAESNECHHLAFFLIGVDFAIVISFPQGTSIAQGKHMLNGLSRIITETLAVTQHPLTVSFGHMYHSIYDLAFSFHEAMKLQPALDWKHPQHSDIDITKSTASVSDSALTEANPDTALALDSIAAIDRRANQFMQLVLDGKTDAIDPLIDRIIQRISNESDLEKQAEAAKRLINAVTETMISHPFVMHEQLTDVSGELFEQLQSAPTSEELLAFLRQGIHTLCDDFARIIERQNNPYIVAALEYIDGHYSDPDLTLEEIAENLRIAPNYLSSLFSKSLGRKLFEYINEIRLKKSIELLLNTNSPINEISEKSGFGSPRNYMRIFKKYMNITPSGYRKQHLNPSSPNETEE